MKSIGLFILLALHFIGIDSVAAQTYRETITTSSLSFDSPEPNGNNPPVSYARGTYYYKLFSVSVKSAGTYVFTCDTDFQYGSEGILYKDPGPVADASQTPGASIINALVAVGSARADFTLTKYLAAGQYYLAVSTYAEKVTGSFTLTITAPLPLPVSLIKFAAKPRREGVNLTWSTASETQNAYFEVERSLDGKFWQKLARITGQGTSFQKTDYSWLDTNALDGLYYYRLRQVDTDGKAAYSTVISLMQSISTQVSFFPNPVLSKASFTCPTATTILVSDVTGRLCKKLSLNSGEQQVSLEDLPEGIYILTDETTRQTKRLIKSIQ